MAEICPVNLNMDTSRFDAVATRTHNASRIGRQCAIPWRVNSEERAIKMADKGKGDKGKKEPRKKPALTLKEKRKAKNDKKGNE